MPDEADLFTKIIVYLVIPIAVFGGAIWWLAKNSRIFQASVNAMIRQTLDNQEKSLQLLAQSIENQKQIIRLLEKSSNRNNLSG